MRTSSEKFIFSWSGSILLFPMRPLIHFIESPIFANSRISLLYFYLVAIAKRSNQHLLGGLEFNTSNFNLTKDKFKCSTPWVWGLKQSRNHQVQQIRELEIWFDFILSSCHYVLHPISHLKEMISLVPPQWACRLQIYVVFKHLTLNEYFFACGVASSRSAQYLISPSL